MSRLNRVGRIALWGSATLAGLLLLAASMIVLLTSSEAGSRWLLDRALPHLPGELTIGQVEGRLSSRLLLHQVAWQDDDQHVHVERITLDWNPIALLDGTVHIRTLAIDGLWLQVSETPADDAPPSLALPPPPRLPLALQLDRFALDAGMVARGDQHWPLPAVELEGRAAGDKVTLGRLDLTQEAHRLHAFGTLRLQPNYPVQLHFNWQLAETPMTASGHGRITGSLERLQLQHTLAYPAEVLLTGEIQSPLSAAQWQLRVESEALNPIRIDPTWPDMPTGFTLAAHGDQARFDWSARARIEHAAPHGEPLTAQLEANGHGDLASLTVEHLQLHHPAGRVAANAHIDWPEPSWRFEADLFGLDPAPFAPDWPGQLEGQLHGHGQLREGALQLELALPRLHGSLRELPVDAGLQLVIDGDAYRLERLELRHAEAHLHAAGEFNAEALAIDWRFHVPDLAALDPRARGQLAGQGSVTGPLDAPALTVSSRGSDLLWEALRLDRFSAEVQAEGRADAPFQLDLMATGLHQGTDEVLRELRLEGTGTTRDHRIQLQAESDWQNQPSQLALTLTGDYHDTAWDARISQITLISDWLATPPWQLETATALYLSATHQRLDTSCLAADQARLCARFDRQPSGSVGGLSLSGLPLATLRAYLPPEIEATGLIDLSASFEQPSGTPPTLFAAAGLREVEIDVTLTEDEQVHLAWETSWLSLAHDAQSSRLQSRFASQTIGHLQLDATLRDDGGPLPQRPLQAALAGDLGLLGLLPLFAPEVADAEGRLQVDLELAGSPAQPTLHGALTLADGQIEMPRFGLIWRDLSARIHGEGDEVTFLLSGRSGDGILTGEGRVSRTETQPWQVTMTLNGDRVLAVNIPEAHVLISPDLEVTLQPGQVDLRGEVAIPVATLTPPDIGSAVTASPDSMVVGDDRDGPATPWQVRSRIRLRLGDQVTFAGHGLTTRITGTLEVVEEPGRLTSGRGELQLVDGRYRAYGQDLTLERGRFLFTADRPIDDPGLDLRAIRTVREVTAGIAVRGTLHDPQTSLFSTPAMDQSNILAWLLLGRPLGQASRSEGEMLYGAALGLGLAGGEQITRAIGQAFGLDEVAIDSATGDVGDTALTLGTHLSSRLYVAYSVGLFDALSLWRMRYTLSRRWAIQTESGSGHQGGDLLFTLER